MDDKLTKFFLPLAVCPSLPPLPPSVIPCLCFEAHVPGSSPPLSLLAAVGREPLYFQSPGDILSSACVPPNQKSD